MSDNWTARCHFIQRQPAVNSFLCAAHMESSPKILLLKMWKFFFSPSLKFFSCFKAYCTFHCLQHSTWLFFTHAFQLKCASRSAVCQQLFAHKNCVKKPKNHSRPLTIDTDNIRQNSNATCSKKMLSALITLTLLAITLLWEIFAFSNFLYRSYCWALGWDCLCMHES